MNSDGLSFLTAAFQVDGDNEIEADADSSRFETPTIHQAVENIKLAEFNEVRPEPDDTDPEADPGLELEDENDRPDTDNQQDTDVPQPIQPESIPRSDVVAVFGPDRSTVVPMVTKKSKIGQMSDLEIEMAIFCLQSGISRADFKSLRGIFRTIQDQEMKNLPHSVDTIKLHLKSLLPFLELRQKDIKLLEQFLPTLPGRQQGGTEEPSNTEGVFYFEPKELFRRLIASDIADKMHWGMGEVVLLPVELWESMSWTGSCRTTSGEFAHYPSELQSSGPSFVDSTNTGNANASDVDWHEFIGRPEGPVLPSDFVRFQCSRTTCSCHSQPDPNLWHVGRVVNVGLEKRKGAHLEGKKALQIQWIWSLPFLQNAAGGEHVTDILNHFMDDQADWRPHPKERFMIQGWSEQVPESSVYPYQGKIIVHYAFDSRVKSTARPSDADLAGINTLFVRRLFVRSGFASATPASAYPYGRWRPIWKTNPIRGELEIMHFSRNRITRFDTATNGGIEVYSVPLCTFIDGFGLYRNMRRSITGFYFIPANLPFAERNRRANVLPFTLGPHGSNMDGIVDAVGASLRELDAGVEVTMPDGKKIILLVFTLVYIGDTPQQQENSGMLSHTATYGCRACHVHRDERGDVDFDIIEHGRFHHEVERIRRHIESGVDSQQQSKDDAEAAKVEAEKVAALEASLRRSGAPRPRKKKNMGPPTVPVRLTAEQERHAADDNLVRNKTAREEYANGLGMSVVRPPLQKISPALDIVLSRPPEPAHSEYNGLSQLVHGLFIKQVLIPKALIEYGRILRSFVFPPGWPRLKNPLHYLGSYTLSEHARWSIIIPLLLRTWLKDEHIQPDFRQAVRRELEDPVLNYLAAQFDMPKVSIPASAIVTRFMTAMARNNMNLMSNKATLDQRNAFLSEMKLYRRLFQGMMEAGAAAANEKPQSRQSSLDPDTGKRGTTTRGAAKKAATTRGRGKSRAVGRGGGSNVTRDDTPDTDAPADSIETEVGLEDSIRSAEYRKMKNRPNVHIGLHWATAIQEYGFASNLNVLAGEDKHRLFKEDIYNTNYINPGRDLLQRQSISMTLRFIAQGGYMDYPELSAQIQSIFEANPALFDRILPRSERTNPDELSVLDGYEDIVSDNKHTGILTGQRLPAYYMKDFQLKPVMSNRMPDIFRAALQTAYGADYSMPNQQAMAQATTPIHWWKRFGFDDTISQRRVVYRRGDFVKYRGNNIGRIDNIFTHGSTKKVRVFVEITPTAIKDQVPGEPAVDPIVELSIHKLAGKSKRPFIVGLPALGGQKVWMVPFKRSGRNTVFTMGDKPLDLVEGDELMYVEWDVQWL